VCDQCHLSGAVRLSQPSKRLADFRPGQDLAEYIEVFVASSTRMKVNSHSDALAGSRCKQESGGKLWCGTCHNPHRPTASFNTICQNCHEKPHRTGDCTGCHMPKGKAYDGGHTVFTDHTLSVRPRPRALASYFGRDASPRNLGLAYIQLARDQRDTGYLDKAWPLLRLAVSSKPRDPELYFNIGVVLEADGREAQAAAYYRESLDQDPLQPEALNRLAALLGNTAEAKKLRQQSAAILPLPF
jgi:tetratricopeptide (TPR) repeat protein